LVPFFPYQVDNNVEGDLFILATMFSPLILRPQTTLLMVAIPLQG